MLPIYMYNIGGGGGAALLINIPETLQSKQNSPRLFVRGESSSVASVVVLGVAEEGKPVLQPAGARIDGTRGGQGFAFYPRSTMRVPRCCFWFRSYLNGVRSFFFLRLSNAE